MNAIRTTLARRFPRHVILWPVPVQGEGAAEKIAAAIRGGDATIVMPTLDHENQLRREQFHGIVQLHSDDTSHGVYGFVRGSLLSEALLKPALAKAAEFLPHNFNELIDAAIESLRGKRSNPAGSASRAPGTPRSAGRCRSLPRQW